MTQPQHFLINCFSHTCVVRNTLYIFYFFDDSASFCFASIITYNFFIIKLNRKL